MILDFSKFSKKTLEMKNKIYFEKKLTVENFEKPWIRLKIK